MRRRSSGIPNMPANTSRRMCGICVADHSVMWSFFHSAMAPRASMGAPAGAVV